MSELLEALGCLVWFVLIGFVWLVVSNWDKVDAAFVRWLS